jgi:hypothetical protein
MTNIDTCDHHNNTLAQWATSYRSPCWKASSNGFVPCNHVAGAYCIMTCSVCIHAGGFFQKDNCTFQQIGTPGCTSTPDLNGCVLINCGS